MGLLQQNQHFTRSASNLEGVCEIEGWEQSVYMYSLYVQITIVSFFLTSDFKCSI